MLKRITVAELKERIDKVGAKVHIAPNIPCKEAQRRRAWEIAQVIMEDLVQGLYITSARWACAPGGNFVRRCSGGEKGALEILRRDLHL